MNRRFLIGICAAALLAGICVFAEEDSKALGPKKQLLRVGVYDSRAITIAYCHSRYSDNVIAARSKEKEQAEDAQDSEAVQRIEQSMKHLQLKRHLQGFGTAPVHDLLKCIEKQIPEIARRAGVDVIVSKWEFDYLAGDAETTDVTMSLVEALEPTEKAIGWIRQIMDMKPMTEADILRHELDGGH